MVYWSPWACRGRLGAWGNNKISNSLSNLKKKRLIVKLFFWNIFTQETPASSWCTNVTGLLFTTTTFQDLCKGQVLPPTAFSFTIFAKHCCIASWKALLPCYHLRAQLGKQQNFSVASCGSSRKSSVVIGKQCVLCQPPNWWAALVCRRNWAIGSCTDNRMHSSAGTLHCSLVTSGSL